MIINWYDGSKTTAAAASEAEVPPSCEYCGSTAGYSKVIAIIRKRQGTGPDRYKKIEKLVCKACLERFKPCYKCGAISTNEDSIFSVADPTPSNRDDAEPRKPKFICGICMHDKVESKFHSGVKVAAAMQCPSCGLLCDGANMTLFAGRKLRGHNRELNNEILSGIVAEGFLTCRKCAVKMKGCSGCGEYSTRLAKMHCRINCKDKHPSSVDMCEQCIADSVPKVSEYNFVPEMVFHTHKSATPIPATSADKLVSDPFFGVELEMDCGGKGKSYAKWAAEHIYKQFYFKRDGSLSQLGIEAVSYPATLEAHIKRMAWKELLDKGRECGYVSWNANVNCGLHIHISRWALDPTQKFSNKPNGNNAKSLAAVSAFYGKNTWQIATLSGRENEQYSSLRVFQEGVAPAETPVNTGGGHGLNRYWAVNFSNRFTVELRHFRGSMRLKTILMGITYAHALSAFCVDTSDSKYEEADLSWDRFCQFVQDKALIYEPYELLVDELTRRGLWLPDSYTNKRWLAKHTNRIITDIVYEEITDHPEVTRSEINSNVQEA